MVLADLGRKITTALHSLSKATIINEEVSHQKYTKLAFVFIFTTIEIIFTFFFAGSKCYAQGDLHSSARS